ncbi:MAG: DNA primase large subunit PriL [Thermoplasmata archaeon]|nr:DNA primase large subunit PriL [Thermoplasmata archaeon]
MDLHVIARYPFLEEAREWVKSEAVSIEEVLNEAVYDRARERAMERVKQAVEKGIIKPYPCVEESDCVMEIFSYPIARMIVAAVESDFLIRRYALAEAKKAYETLKNEDASFINFMLEKFGISMHDGKIHFTDYLKYAPTWHSKWKLVNRIMERGYIRLEKNEMARLLQEAIRKKIQDELFYLFAPPEVRKIFGELINRLRAKTVVKEDKKYEGEESMVYFPPCIKSLISAARNGINIPHVGRFTLVTFLNAVGMPIDDIVSLFRSSPDFNEEKTRYQIEHITGKISGTIYSVPKCATIRTWGLCNPDELCRKVSHPMIYYRIKRGKNEVPKEKVL